MRRIIGVLILACIIGAQAAPPTPPPQPAPVRIALDVTSDTKIIVDGKPITFEKFAVLIEFAAGAFDIDEVVYKDRKFSTLKLVLRPAK